MKFLPEISYILIISIYSYFITKIVPKKLYSYSNLMLGFGAIGFGIIFGVSPNNQGFNINNLIHGLLLGIIFSLPIIFVILVIATSNAFGAHFSKTPRKYYNKKTFLYEFLFRIPFGTALSEEIIFRGVLLGLLTQRHSFILSIVISSILFGCWHIFPTLHTSKSHDPLIEYMDNQRKRNLIAVIIAVISTAITGALFTIVNSLSGSLISSWIIHTSINSFAILGGYIVVWYEHRRNKNSS